MNIIGCGNLGSALAYSVLLYNSDNPGFIKELNLVDNDILEEKNLPFGVCGYNDYKINLGCKKSNILKRHLDKLFNFEHTNFIQSTPHTFPDCYLISNCLTIDCRDTPENQELTHLKFTLDGQYGRIIKNPQSIHTKFHKRYNYSINPSKFYANKFSYVCIEHILKYDYSNETTMTVFDLLNNKEINIE